MRFIKAHPYLVCFLFIVATFSILTIPSNMGIIEVAGGTMLVVIPSWVSIWVVRKILSHKVGRCDNQA